MPRRRFRFVRTEYGGARSPGRQGRASIDPADLLWWGCHTPVRRSRRPRASLTGGKRDKHRAERVGNGDSGLLEAIIPGRGLAYEGTGAAGPDKGRLRGTSSVVLSFVCVGGEWPIPVLTRQTLRTVLRRLPRRRIATLIRVRQEIDKRADPLFPWRAGSSSLEHLLVPTLAVEARGLGQDPDALRRVLAARSAGRFPLAHLRGRPVAALPAREVLSESVAQVASGEWRVFGVPVRVDAREFDWTRHPTTGAVAPKGHWANVSYIRGVGGGDVKLLWELSRHQHLLRLAQGYFLDGDESVAETLLVLIDRWIAQNPRGRGINWTSSLEIAFRSIAWCWIWALTCESRAWTPDRVRRFLLSLWHHARHIERFDSLHHSPNTHLTGEGLGLLYTGLLFPEFGRAAHWARRGQEILDSEMTVQVFDDGMHFERAVGYHRYTAEFYLHYLLLANAFGLAVGPGFRERVRAQVNAARVLRRPDGTWPVIGDEDSGDTLLLTATDPHDQGPILAVGAALFRDPGLLSLTNERHRAASWWLLSDTDWGYLLDHTRSADARGNGARAASVLASGARAGAAQASEALPTAGYFVARDDDGADAWWCLVDAGPHGGDHTGHAHTDLGHIEIAYGASHIIVDPGCVSYTTDPSGRDLARSEWVHACVVVEGAPLASPAGPFSWSRMAPTPSHWQADNGEAWSCELFYERQVGAGRLAHRRQVVLVRGHGILVCDWLDGVSPSPLAVHWPLGETPSEDALTERSLTTASFSATWSAHGGVGELRPSLEPLARSPGYGRQCDGRLLRLAFSGSPPVSIVTCFSEPGREFRVRAHGAESVQVALPAGPSEEPSVIVLSPGRPPGIKRTPAPVTSHGAIG